MYTHRYTHIHTHTHTYIWGKFIIGIGSCWFSSTWISQSACKLETEKSWWYNSSPKAWNQGASGVIHSLKPRPRTKSFNDWRQKRWTSQLKKREKFTLPFFFSVVFSSPMVGSCKFILVRADLFSLEVKCQSSRKYPHRHFQKYFNNVSPTVWESPHPVKMANKVNHHTLRIKISFILV